MFLRHVMVVFNETVFFFVYNIIRVCVCVGGGGVHSRTRIRRKQNNYSRLLS